MIHRWGKYPGFVSQIESKRYGMGNTYRTVGIEVLMHFKDGVVLKDGVRIISFEDKEWAYLRICEGLEGVTVAGGNPGLMECQCRFACQKGENSLQAPV